MKITALIPDDLVAEVRQIAAGKNLTESLIVALQEWLAVRKLQRLKDKVDKNPLQFSEGFSSSNVRKVNRT